LVGIALAEQIKVETSLSEGIIDALLARARQKESWYWSIPVLGKLQDHPHVGEGLLALARDRKVDTYMRVDAVEALGRLGRTDDLLALARDEKVNGLGQTKEAAPILLTLTRDDRVDTDVRVHAAAQAILALARDKKVEADMLVRVAEVLGRLGRTEEATQVSLALARDGKVRADVRVRAATQAGLALAHDKKVEANVRVRAA
jgi:hypothetical protein